MQLTMRIRGGTAGVVWFPPSPAKEYVVSFTFFDTNKTPRLVIYGTLSDFKACLCWSTIELTRMAPNLVYHLPSLIVPKVFSSRSLVVLLPVLFDILVYIEVKAPPTNTTTDFYRQVGTSPSMNVSLAVSPDIFWVQVLLLSHHTMIDCTYIYGLASLMYQ